MDLSIPSKPKGSRFAHLEWEFTSSESNSAATAILSSLGGNITFRPQYPPLPDHLTTDQEERVTQQVIQLYNTLKPREEFRTKRMEFLARLQAILDGTWPDHMITAHLFGSSVNGLGTEASDVDVCLVTPWEDLENGVSNVHVFASVMRRNKMHNVYTISKAKVPICKFYDPVYHVNCDVNINNTLALRNTQFIKAYVDIDDRVRPLLLILKHWTKQRDLNDAVKGGTLSSYCWVQMFLNFLQTRNPPILPSLQKLYLDQLRNGTAGPPKMEDGVDCSFYSDLDSLKDFGKENKETLGGLLYAFFRKFAVEFDYDNCVVSVRVGGYMSKDEKGWNVEVERMCRHLCVEEPFTVTRNLANSADATTVIGLRLEFELAAHMLASSSSNLALVMEKYIPKLTIQSSPMINYAREAYVNGVLISPEGMLVSAEGLASGMLPGTTANGLTNGVTHSHSSKANGHFGKSRAGHRNTGRPYQGNGYSNYNYPYSYANGYSSNASWQTYPTTSRPGRSSPPINGITSPNVENGKHRHAATITERRGGSPAEYHGSSSSEQQGRILHPREYPEYHHERVFDEFGTRDYFAEDCSRHQTSPSSSQSSPTYSQGMATPSHERPPRLGSSHSSYNSYSNDRSTNCSSNSYERANNDRPTNDRRSRQREQHQYRHQQERRNYSSSPVPVVALEHRSTQTGGLGLPPTHRRNSSNSSIILMTSPTSSAGVSQVDGRSEFVVRDEVRESATQTPPSPLVGRERISQIILHPYNIPHSVLCPSISSTDSSPTSISTLPYMYQWGDLKPERRASAPIHTILIPTMPPSPDTLTAATRISSESPPPVLDESPCPSPDGTDGHQDAFPKQQRKANKASKKGTVLWSNTSTRGLSVDPDEGSHGNASSNSNSTIPATNSTSNSINITHTRSAVARSPRPEVRDPHRHPHSYQNNQPTNQHPYAHHSSNQQHHSNKPSAGHRKRAASVPPSTTPRDVVWSVDASVSVTPAELAAPLMVPNLSTMPRPESYRDALERGRLQQNDEALTAAAVGTVIVPSSESFALDDVSKLTRIVPTDSSGSRTGWTTVNGSNNTKNSNIVNGGTVDRRRTGNSYRGARGGGRGRGGRNKGGEREKVGSSNVTNSNSISDPSSRKDGGSQSSPSTDSNCNTSRPYGERESGVVAIGEPAHHIIQETKKKSNDMGAY
ncbi:hypothetical protein SeLEV6574_g01929 [Synchytrium endobioticum]|uniref:polynucleotide adenylyltransferase n=1 Tax=Synchytrium endobioticum TaxID=286115 RepID=A0A507DBG6_9FUNG|nr:hypothetical protein SeLEV6574_g01929 [Synchytrium endobioticum]